jgi:hypothetical protein
MFFQPSTPQQSYWRFGFLQMQHGVNYTTFYFFLAKGGNLWRFIYTWFWPAFQDRDASPFFELCTSMHYYRRIGCFHFFSALVNSLAHLLA